ncbi:hypothetical protein [Skermania piniformis]|uniref:Uncharacterized protein n=1 Tax=Skermania pinensis TaxID=39122 RepID=A0ABX8SEK8_9ACTN|nr:hypothetical protein [Skermania piniformis]QXQ14865.1 hypothetical protein KV203_05640 [Skermania piniformis]
MTITDTPVSDPEVHEQKPDALREETSRHAASLDCVPTPIYDQLITDLGIDPDREDQ